MTELLSDAAVDDTLTASHFIICRVICSQAASFFWYYLIHYNFKFSFSMQFARSKNDVDGYLISVSMSHVCMFLLFAFFA